MSIIIPDYIFTGIENKDVDIILGQEGRNIYHNFCTNQKSYEEFALGLASARRAYYDACARGENPPFPG